jgi:hypothetical protein
MGLRAKLNDNPVVSVVAATALLLVCISVVLLQFGEEGASFKERYFYDVNTGKIFIDSGRAPIKAPSGPTDDGEPAGMRATIYACGECRGSYAGMTRQAIEQADATLAYVERYVKAEAGAANRGNGPSNNATGEPEPTEPQYAAYVAKVTDATDELDWKRAPSGAGIAVYSSVNLDCATGEPVRCSYGE